MGRTMTPKYRVEFVTKGEFKMTPTGWTVKTYGKANAENLMKYVQSMNASFKKGGVNEAVSAKFGENAVIYKATLIRQSDNEIIAVSYMTGSVVSGMEGAALKILGVNS